MDPLGEYTGNDGRGLPPTVDEELEEDFNVSIIRSVQIFLNDSLPGSKSPAVLESSLSEKIGDDDHSSTTDPLNIEINYGDIKREEIKDDAVEGIATNGGEGCNSDVIKQEPQWEDEEIDIVDDHLDNLSKCPRKRVRELKVLLVKETEENLESGNGTVENKRYALRQRTSLNRISSLKSYKSADFAKDESEEENNWSDDSDKDPIYAPHEEETEADGYQAKKKTKRKYTSLRVKKSHRSKKEHKKLLCLYCKRKYKTIVKHLLTAHPNEPDVKIILDLPMKSEERKEALAVLLKKIEENDVKGVDEDEEYIKKVKKNMHRCSEKRSFCFYCKKSLRNLARHLLINHENEPYIKYLSKLPRGSEERKGAFKLILNKGNFAYNQEVISSGTGSIVSSRSQKDQNKVHSFAPCHYCFGFYKLIDLHERNCFQRVARVATIEEITRKYENVEDCLSIDNHQRRLCDIDILKKKKKKVRRKFKPLPANVKVAACLYCKERVRLLPRHLITYHDDKPYVKHFMNLPKGSEERKTALKLIRNKGNFIYNKDVIAKGEGSIICKRSQKGQVQTSNFLPCGYCFAFFNKQTLKHHQENCLKKSGHTDTTVSDDNEFSDVIPSDFSAMDIIQNLVKGNLVGEESDLDLKPKTNPVKKTACYYCNKLTTKLGRHLQLFHSDNPDVKHVLSLKKGSEERYQALQTIRRKGNFLYNKKSLNNKNVTFLTPRKPKSNKITYFPCEFCFGFYTLNTLMKHKYKCKRNTMSTKAKNEELKHLCEFKRKRDINTFCSTLLNCPTSISYNAYEILLPQNTKLASLAKNDSLILKYGAYLLGRGKMSAKVIGKKMCALAHLVVRINVFEPSVSNLRKSFSADLFKTFLKSAVQICMKAKGSIAVGREKSLRTSIQHCCMIAKNDSLFEKDDSALKQINDFFALFAEHWSKLLLPTLLEDLKGRSNKPEASKTSNAAIDWIKEDFVQSSSVDQVSSFNDIDHCSRLYGTTKKSVCFFCHKESTKIVRHWILLHHSEPEIKKLSKLEKNSRERKYFIMALRNKGNYFHNKKVLQQNKGCLVRKRGRALLNGYDDYLPCEYCLGFFSKKLLRLHLKRCPLNPLLAQGKGGSINIRIRKKLQMPLIMNELENESPDLNTVVERIKSCGLKQTIKNDDLIMKCGRLCLSQKSPRQKSFREASYQMQSLARILVHLSGNGQVQKLGNYFQPENFGFILNAIREIALLRSPKLASALIKFKDLRVSVLTCLLILKNECLLKNNESKLKELNECEVMLNSCELSTDNHIRYNNRNGSSLVVPKGQVTKWKKAEIDAILSHFSSHLKNGVIPGKFEIEEFFSKHENLKFRGWLRVKYQIYNLMRDKIGKLHSQKDEISGNVGSQLPETSDNVETQVRVNQKYNSETLNPDKVGNETQSKRPENDIMPSLLNQEITPKCVKTSGDQLNSRISSNTLMKDLEDFCNDISLSSQPFTTIQTQSVNFNEHCPSDNEERTYLLLSSCDYAHQGSKSLTSVFDDSQSNKQLEGTLGLLNTSTPGASFDMANAREFLAESESCQNESRSVLSPDLQVNSSLNHPACRPLNGGNKVNREKSEQNSYSTTINVSAKSPSIGTSPYKNKGIKRAWNNDEIIAVMSFFSIHLKTGKVPSKVECLDCIAENRCLQFRDWISVKSKVYNLIKSNNNTSLETKKKDVRWTLPIEGNQSTDSTISSDSDDSFVIRSKRRKMCIKNTPRENWTSEENAAITIFFKYHINNHIIPGKKDCEECISLNKCLAARSWVKVKSKVYNIISFNKRKNEILTRILN